MKCYECRKTFDNEEDTGISKIFGSGRKTLYNGPLICNKCAVKYASGKSEPKGA